MTAAAGALLLWTAFALGGQLAPGQAPVDVALLMLQLDTVAAALGVVVGILCFLRWRWVGDAAALLLGVGALLFGTITVGALPLVTILQPRLADAEMLGWLAPASRLVAIWVLWRAARTPQVDTTLKARRVLAVGVLAIAAAVTALAVAPGLSRAVASLGDPLDGISPTTAGSTVIAAAWLLLALAHGYRGTVTRHWLHLWFGVALLAFALSELLWLLDGTPEALWAAGPAALRVLGLAWAATGATREIGRAFAEQRGRLLETITSGLTAEARMRAEQALAQERAHEARNALTAIEGATRTLEMYRDRLDGDTQASLSRAITTEIARLQRLVSPEQATSRAVAFRVADTLTPIVVSARTQGADIDLRVPGDLMAHGRPGETAEVVQNLIENARRYASGSAVTLRAERQRGGVVVRVEDRGPGVPESDREQIFARGFRGDGADSAGGSGLGLYICARLMQEQDGEVWVEDRPGGGASFALWLPEAAEGPAEPAVGAPAAPAAGTDADNVYPIFGPSRITGEEPGVADRPGREVSDDVGG